MLAKIFPPYTCEDFSTDDVMKKLRIAARSRNALTLKTAPTRMPELSVVLHQRQGIIDQIINPATVYIVEQGTIPMSIGCCCVYAGRIPFGFLFVYFDALCGTP